MAKVANLRNISAETDEVSRTNGYRAAPSRIVIEHGFNVRGIGMTEAEYWGQPDVKEHVEELTQAYISNPTLVQPIVVKPREDGMLVVRDGHHRKKALDEAIKRGAEIQYVDVREFKGDQADEYALMLGSANSRPLTAVEKAQIFYKLTTYGFTPEQIASKTFKSVSHVIQMLKVYELPMDVKKALQLKKITVQAALNDGPTKEEAKAERKAHRAVTPPKKVVRAFSEFMATYQEAKVVEDKVVIEMPKELYEQFMNGLPKSEEVDENQECLPLEDSNESDSSANE